jgi:3-hydroxyacyl-[acyl-carrier-protein] dehydratase
MDPMDIQAIQAVLPHRYPFLLVDRVDSCTVDKIVARKMVTANEPFFMGHFPGHPVMPGVLIMEALAQAGALLAASQIGFDPAADAIFLMSMDKVKFRKPVVPGDALVLEVVPLRRGGAIWKLRGEALVDGEVVAEAEFVAGIKKLRKNLRST